MKRDRERIGPGEASSNTNCKRTKIKIIADLLLGEQWRLLEAEAEHATLDYETDKELTVFTELDGVAND